MALVTIVERPVTITFPAENQNPQGCLVTIHDTISGRQLRTVTHASIRIIADANSVITADLTMFTDPDGMPADDPVPDSYGGISTGTFRFPVAEIKVA
jgi:hypothetical protein